MTLYTNPMLSPTNIPNLFSAKIEPLSNLRVRQSLFDQTTNGTDILNSYLAASVRISRRSASFLPHVMQVIGLRPKKQVGRVDARRPVTAVKNAEPFWNWSPVYLERDSVRLKEFSYVRSGATDRAVAVRGEATAPQPTVLCGADFHKSPEPFFNCCTGILSGHRSSSLRCRAGAAYDSARSLFDSPNFITLGEF